MGESLPTRRADLAIFASDDGRVYPAGDVVAAAYFRGALQAPWERLLRRLAADELAAERDLETDDDALQALSDGFRSDRDLITAEETEKWLEARALTLEDFTDYFVRLYWGNALAAKIEAEEIEYIAAPDELRDLFAAELLLSGELDQLSTELSWRVASHRAGRDRDLGRDALAGERKIFLDRTHLDENGLREWLEGLGRDADWLDEMLELEACYRRARLTLVTDELCRRELAAVRLQYAQVEVETIELESQNAAREALMCVRNDGLSLEEVAAEGSYPHQRGTFLLEDLPAGLHERVLCAAPGELLDPVPHGDGFQVCRIHQKSEPTLDDVETRRRIEVRILAAAFTELCARHIKWRLPASFHS